MSKIFKDSLPMVPVPGTGSRQTTMGPDSLYLKTDQFVAPVKLDSGFPQSSRTVMADSLFSKLVPLDSLGNFGSPVQFSLGIAEKCTRHEKVSKFLSTAANGMEKLDLSDLSDLVDFQVTITDMQRNQATSSSLQSQGSRGKTKPSFFYPAGILDCQEQLVEFLDQRLPNPSISINSDGKISFEGSITEMKDLLSVLEEFYLPRWSKPTMLVPQFEWASAIETQISANHAALQLESLRFAPLKSPEKVKVKQPPRRKSKKRSSREPANLYEKNYSRACETFLSVMMDRNRSGKSVIRSLKKSGAELPHLLNQFSTTIAGTGLAIIFSILCKVACGRASLYSTSKVLTASIGIGMFWMSWAVNKLNKTVLHIKKSPAKLGFEEEKEMARRVDQSINDIFFSAATVTAMAMLKLA